MENLSVLVAQLPKKSILVVGDLMLDEHVWSTVTRISPEAPVPVADVKSVTYAPGGSANVASNIVALGGIPYLVGVIGHDIAGDMLKKKLAEREISSDYLVESVKRQTTHKTRIIAHHQHVVRVDKEDRGDIGPELTQQIKEKIDSLWDQIDAVLISDYHKGVLTPELCQYIIQGAKSRQKIVSVDPKGEDFSKYRGATIVTPNLHEAEVASKITLDVEKNLQKVGLKLLATMDSDYLLVTQGEKGMTLFYPGKPSFHIPTVAQEVFDITGAGDTVISTLTLALAAGISIETAVEIANHAAGIVVGKVGTATVSLEELDHVLSKD
jgi:D-beta-D-heptose 7-phosphate kinase/D-beta-D-heptose 1-phosphate adenosyltransferase